MHKQCDDVVRDDVVGNDKLGKKAEEKIKLWLDRPAQGYSLDRIPDQVSGFYGSKNICDFTLFKYPNYFYIESKATWADRFDFSMITEYQLNNLIKKCEIPYVYSYIILLFATHKRAFILPIQEINRLIHSGKKSLNINKLSDWNIKYSEIQTIPNSRKLFLDYCGEIEDHLIIDYNEELLNNV